MDYSVRKIYQLANLQFLVLNLTYDVCFSSYIMEIPEHLDGDSLACPLNCSSVQRPFSLD